MPRLALVAMLILPCFVLSSCGGGAATKASVPGGGGNLPAGSIQPSFFGLDLGPPDPWPTQLGVQFGIWRSLGSLTRWGSVQPVAPAGGPTSDPNDPSYDWKSVDTYFAKATQHQQQILYTAYYTPDWASQQPSQPCQQTQYQNAGGCYPPIDVENGDLYWKSFLTALYKHVTANGWHIAYWECWNEPNIDKEWSGSLTDLNTMCADLYSTIKALDPTAKFTTPAPTDGPSAGHWLAKWFSLPNSSVANADIIAFHGYVCTDASTCSATSAEQFNSVVLNNVEQAAAAVAGKPIWDTEGSDLVGNTPILDPDLHAAFYARFTLLQQSAGIAMFSYWGWNFGDGDNLVDSPSDDPNAITSTLTTAGIAWQQIYNWTVGSTYTSACGPTSGTIYTCGLKNLNGDPILIVWDSADGGVGTKCTNDVCGNSVFTGASNFSQCTNLAGQPCASPISGGNVTVGAKPVLLQ